MDNKIGEFIAKLRKNSNMTQENLADKLMMTRENVSKIERGINKPTIETLLILSNIFDTSLNELLSGKRKNKVNEKEIDNISNKYNYEIKIRYRKIILSMNLIFIIILLLINFKVSKENRIYSFKTTNNLEGIIVLKNNYVNLWFINTDNCNMYTLYYKENFSRYKTYSFITSNNILESTPKEIVLGSSYIDSYISFKYNYFNKNIILNNLYIKIDNQEYKINVNYKDLIVPFNIGIIKSFTYYKYIFYT